MAKPARIFITGFGPFGRVKENPSAWLAERLGQDHRVLEVSFKAVEQFLNEFDAESYDTLILLGAHGRAEKLHLERFAVNRISKVRDVERVKRKGRIDTSGPIKIQSSLWPRRMPKDPELRRYTRVSRSAGSYLCNYILYRSLQEFPNLKVGFLHVPSPKKMELEDQLAAAKLILERMVVVTKPGKSETGR